MDAATTVTRMGRDARKGVARSRVSAIGRDPATPEPLGLGEVLYECD
jgi:hypothetical protein